MIIETIPELQSLNSRQKLILASELWEEYANQPDHEQDEAIHSLLKHRMEEYRANRSVAIDWEDLKKLAEPAK